MGTARLSSPCRWLRSPAIAVTAALALLAGCASTAPPVSGGGHPSAAPCHPPPTLAAPPRRIVTMDGAAAAILTELGAGERIVGTAAPDFFAAFPPGMRAQLAKIPVLDPGQGNAEKVINAKPDLVVGVSSYSFGGFDGTPTVERLTKAGASVLVACDTATAGPVRDLAQTTTFIEQAAKVLGVEQRGVELSDRIQSEINQAIRQGRVSTSAAPVRVLAVSAAPVAGQPVLTQGGRSLANGVITLAGGRNIAEDVPADFASLSAEKIVSRDPQAIVVISGFEPGGDAELISAVRASPVLAASTAVREHRLVVVPQSILLSPSVLNGQAVAMIAACLRKPAT